MAPHSSTLAWKIPWTEEPGGPQSMGSLRVGQDSATSLSLFTFLHGILQAIMREGLPCPPPGDLPNPGMELRSLTSPALAGGSSPPAPLWKALVILDN